MPIPLIGVGEPLRGKEHGMAKRKAAKKKRRRIGPTRSIPKGAASSVKKGLAAVRQAKVAFEKGTGGSRKAWSELHNIESRLSRLK